MEKISNNIYLLRGGFNTLSEATFEIEESIDFILDKYKSLRDEILSNKYLSIVNRILYSSESVIVHELSSSDFKSEILRKAHKMNPIKIKIGILEESPSYSYSRKEITLGFNKRILHYLVRADFDFRIAIELLKAEIPSDNGLSSKIIEFRNFFSEGEMISQIVHEVSHWLRDTFSKGKLFSNIDKKSLKKRTEIMELKAALDKEISSKDRADKKRRIEYLNRSIENILNQGEEHRNLSPYEIDAQIHELVTLRKRIDKEEWNKLSFDSIFQYLSHLKVIEELLKNDRRLFTRWKHLLFVRMLREGILPEKIKTTYRENAEKTVREYRYQEHFNHFTLKEHRPDMEYLEDMLYLSEIRELREGLKDYEKDF